MHNELPCFSTDKRSLITVLRAAGGSNTPSSSVTKVDIKHDPMFSHPPPWAAVEKIYAVITNKAKPDSSIFNVKKFDFKMTEIREEKPKTTSPKQPQKSEQRFQQKTYSQPQQPQASSTQYYTSQTQSSNSFNQKVNHEKNVNEAITVTEKNDARDSVKYTSTVHSSDPFKLNDSNLHNDEPIYDDPKACDNIEVIEEYKSNVKGDSPSRKLRKENNILLKLKTTTAKLQKDSREKSEVLRNKMSSLMSHKTRSDNKVDERSRDSLYSRIVKKVKKSSVRDENSSRSNVRNVNFTKIQESIKDVRVKLTRNKENKQIEEKSKRQPKVLKITKANNTEIYTAAPIDDNIDFKGFKNKMLKFPWKVDKSTEVTAGPDNNNKFKCWKTKLSQNKIKVLPRFQLKGKTNDDKSVGEAKRSRFSLAKLKRQNSNTLTNNVNTDKTKSFFGKFNIGEKWSEMRQPKECSEADNKIRSFTSATNGKKTFLSDGQNSLSRAGSRNYNSSAKPFDSRYSGARDTHQYKWNFVDGQWRKSGTVGL